MRLPVLLLTVLLLPQVAELSALDDACLHVGLKNGLVWDVYKGDRRLGWSGKSKQHTDTIVLEINRRDGKWQKWGFLKHPSIEACWSRVAVTVSDASDSTLVLSAKGIVPAVSQGSSACVVGGQVAYDIRLNKQGDAWSGTYSGVLAPRLDEELAEQYVAAFGFTIEWGGSFSKEIRRVAIGAVKNTSVKGMATVVSRPVPTRVKQAIDAKSVGHPHLLFTKSDLPALRKRMNIPRGKKIIARIEEMERLAKEFGFGFRTGGGGHSMQSSWSAGLGLLYQLTGDKKHAERAQSYVWSAMYSSLPNLNQWRQAYRILGVALTYDMCYDAWPEAFRTNVYHYLLGHAQEFTRRRDIYDPLNFKRRYTYGGQTISYPRSAAHAEGHKYLAAAAVCAMAIMGDEPPIYQPPGLDTARTIAPADGYVPPSGVPVVELEGGLMFKRWLVNGPFLRSEADPLTAIGGLAKARPIPGTTVTKLGVDLDFRHYLPCALGDRVRGPHMYPRNCGRFFTSSTGNGYWPGRKVAGLYKEKGQRGQVVTWYTVWHNHDEQYIQAFPNRYWQSRGVRMWLNGTEVRDEDLILVKPGYYPVMLYIPVTGGYSTQAPHLGWYSEERFLEERQRYEHCRRLFQVEGGLPAELAQCAARQLRSYLLDQLDTRAWNIDAFPDHLLTFLHCYRHVFGVDMGSDTGVRNIVPLAVLGRSMYKSYGTYFALRHAFPFLSEQDKRIARWAIDRYGQVLNRPIDLVIPFITEDLEIEPLHPSEVYPLAQHYPDFDTFVFNRSHERVKDQHSEDFSVIVSGIGRLGDSDNPMGIEATGVRLNKRGARNWLRGYGGSLINQHEYGSGPFAQGHYNTGSARILHQETLADGGGSVTMEIGPLVPGTFSTDGKKRVILGKPRPSSAIRRSVLVDYSKRSGAEAVVVIMDRFASFGDKTGKFVQFYCPFKPEESMDFKPADNAFVVRDATKRTLNAVLSGRFFAPRKVEMRTLRRDKYSSIGMLQGVLDRRASGAEFAERKQKKVKKDLKNREDDLEAELDAFDAKDDDPVTVKGRDGNEKVSEEYLFTVLVFSSTKAPAISRAGVDDRSVIKVGNAAYHVTAKGLGVKQ